MLTGVQRHVASSPTCQLMKSSRKWLAGQLQPIPPPERAWQQVMMDFVTGLPAGATVRRTPLAARRTQRAAGGGMAAFELEAFPGRTLHVLLFRDVANSAYVLPRHPQTHPPRASRSHPPAPSARPSRRRDPLRPSSAVTSFPHSSPVVARNRATAHAHAHSWRTPVFPLPTPLPPPGSAESHCITEAAPLPARRPPLPSAEAALPSTTPVQLQHGVLQWRRQMHAHIHHPRPFPCLRPFPLCPHPSRALPQPSLPSPHSPFLPPCPRRDLLSQLQSGTMHPEVAFLNATLVPGTFPVLVAAHKALTSAATGCLKSRTLHSELVFNYAASKHIRESLQRCGVAAGTTALLAARFDATQDEVSCGGGVG
ncbi:unnamed protein product [Closterium sp. NIES-54]